jgi:hypothetical protein
MNLKKYVVKFKEVYEYERTITIDEDEEDIDDVIHDPLECPMIKDLSREEYDELNPEVLNEYEVKEI